MNLNTEGLVNTSDNILDRKAKSDFVKIIKKTPLKFWKQILWKDKTKIELFQNNEKRKV